MNSVSPGYVKTDMTSHPPPGDGERWVAKWDEMTPFGRFADPSEIGEMVVLMCSDKASGFMTGHDLVMDGGECGVKTSFAVPIRDADDPPGYTTY